MPTYRYCLILLCLVVGAGLLNSTAVKRTQQPTRWPSEDSFFALPGWSVGPADLQLGDGDQSTGALLRRDYVDLAGRHFTFDLWSNPEPQAKMLFRKGPDRDFQGAGYLTESVSADIATPPPGGGVLIARRGPDAWLVVYSYGERRGLLGNGPMAWSLAEWDGLVDRPNDYFLARVAVPFADDQAAADEAVDLANVLFPRLVSWYAAAD
jgi:hypothetical protein